jgi:Ser/Thr protein kinase RdoA (MazF antagonist)
MSTGGDRLPHGYTNLTRQVAGAMAIDKIYTGSDARVRLTREELCLRLVADVLPVPPVLDTNQERCVLRLGRIAGTPGQDLIEEGAARPALAAAGSLLARLQTHASPLLLPHLEGADGVAVHGDFGPQNLLFDANHRVSGLVDWEYAHRGDAVEDLAWAEWIVRMHHPVAIDALEALFAGYGARPPWSLRQAAMVVQCERFRERCEGDVDAVTKWRTHLETTERWTE